MSVVARVLGRLVPFGGEKHTGWLPQGATIPERTPVRVAILDVEILECGDGFLLEYHSRNTDDWGDFFHERLEDARDQARDFFGIEPDEWREPGGAMIHGKPETVNGFPVPYDASPERLREMVNAGPPERWAAFAALAHHPDPSSLEILGAVAHSADWTLRRAAVEALGAHRDGGRASDTLAELFRDSSPHVVRAACEAAASLGATELREPVIALLGSGESATRMEALRALCVLWDEGDFDRALKLFGDDPDEEVRREAAWVLRARAGDENWREPFRPWLEDSLPRHRVWAAELAGEFGDKGAVPELRLLLSDPDGHVRKAATRALNALESGAG